MKSVDSITMEPLYEYNSEVFEQTVSEPTEILGWMLSTLVPPDFEKTSFFYLRAAGSRFAGGCI